MSSARRDEDKTRDQLTNELTALRQRIAELEAAEDRYKKVEEDSRRQQEELRIMMDSVTAYVFYKDREERHIRVNKALADATGIPQEQWVGKTVFELLPNMAEHYHKDDKEVITSGQPKRNIIEPFETPEGIRWTQTDKIPYKDKEGNTIGLIGFSADITERKWMEEALKESESRYRDLFESASDAILVRDLKGYIIEANQAASDLTGYTLDELANMSISTFLFGRSFELTMERQQALLQGGASAERHDLELIRKDGTRATIEAAIRLITSEGQPVAVYGMARDVTEERRLRENIQFYITEITKAQEEERKRIARELHDETIQAMAALLLDMEAIIRAERLSGETLNSLEQLRRKVETIMEGVRRFSHELRPGVLNHVGLVPTLERLAQDMSISYGIDVYVEVIGAERRLPSEVELVLFRIAQEALSNVRRHSQATEAVIRVEFDLERARVAVNDKGTGFELPTRISDLASMGKLGILGMYERARLIDGSISLETKKGEGTTVAVEVMG